MSYRNRFAGAFAAAALGVCGVSAPALASSSKHWTKQQCQSYVKSFEKKHPHPSKSQQKEGNKTLKNWGCSEVVK